MTFLCYNLHIIIKGILVEYCILLIHNSVSHILVCLWTHARFWNAVWEALSH